MRLAIGKALEFVCECVSRTVFTFVFIHTHISEWFFSTFMFK